MAEVDVHKVVVKHARAGGWYAVSFGRNGEKIAWTEVYEDVRDAEAAGYTISDGATVEREE